MEKFKLDLLDLYWIDRDENNRTDLCLHGRLDLYLDGEKVLKNYEATVGATAFYLLRALESDFIEGEMENYLFPCCGNSFVLEDSDLEILGCNTGRDMSIIHRSDKVELSYEDRKVEISSRDFKEEVYRFVGPIERFYRENKRQIDPDDPDGPGFYKFLAYLGRIRK